LRREAAEGGTGRKRRWQRDDGSQENLNTLFGLSRKHQQVEREERHQVKLHKVTQVNLDSVRTSLRREAAKGGTGSGERDDGSQENLNMFFGLGIQTTAQPKQQHSPNNSTAYEWSIRPQSGATTDW
jgi:hypothetical protein